MFPNKEDFEFIPPPEAPVFEPDEEEWKDPLGYIAKIHPYAVKVGICKIRPPPEWQPPFSIDVEKFRFTPRIQKLNELEAKTRVKLNFIDAIAKFWELQGNQVKLPNIEKKPLDIHELHKIVESEGGFEDVTRLRRWSRIAYRMGYTAPASSSMLRRNYEKILYPYDVFMSGAMTGETESGTIKSKQELKEEKNDADYDPLEDLNAGNETPPSSILTRKLRYKTDSDTSEQIDYSKNSELKKLQFLSPGPKITGNRRAKKSSIKYDKKDFLSDAEFAALTAKVSSNKQNTNIFDMVKTWVDDYRCKVCENGDDEDCMLLCDSCDASYHTFCLIPPLNAVPPGDWRCPKCLAKECKKKTEAYGFEQAKKIYTLADFGEMADKFKEEYFAMPPTKVPVRVVEKEFWRLVSSLDNDVVVEYAADLHTADHGSGFPTKLNSDVEDEDYMKSPWNLNNLPNNEKSILKYISQDISGMKVPWIYVGMCFSSFCWHTEDHWSYSINYHHWGEPKTWYGVPETEAEKLEMCVKNIAPELFEKNPDLFHHLVTLCSPMTLMNHGVPVVRTNQYPGEFVVTFPRAYHAGFNNGYNCAEAVNFCPADWLVTGQECVLHYQKLRRPTVFSHDELICKMATIPDALDLDLAKKLYANMKLSVENEVNSRKKLASKNITDRHREAFELINDDERQCCYCQTTMFFSAVTCSCNKKKMSCLHHYAELCACPDYKKYVRYRYTLGELPEMLANLKKRADSFDVWRKEVQAALLSNQNDPKIELTALKQFITEAEESQFPVCELLEQLRFLVTEAEQCSQVAVQLLTKKHKTRKTTTSSVTTGPRLTLNELKDFVSQVHNLPCVIKETNAIDKLMAQVESFRYDARIVLTAEDYNEKKVVELLEHAEVMDVDLPEINDLRLDLKASKWLEGIEEILNQENPISLDVIRGCVDQGIGLRKKQASEKPLSRLKELLYAADRWEEKAKLCLQAKPRHMMGTLEVIVTEASKVKIVLPNVSALKEALQKAKDWSNKVEKVQNDDYYPYYDILEALVTRGRPIPVRLEQLPQMESQVAAARAWKDRTSRTFVKKGSSKQLMELLRPRKDIGKFERKSKKKKNVKTEATDEKTTSTKLEKHSSKSDKKSDLLKGDRKVDVKSSGKDKEKNIKNKEKAKSDETENSKSKMDEFTTDKKPIGFPVETINVDDYVAPDPLSVAQDLKTDEGVEMNAIKELRQKNRQKLLDDNFEAPYCVCRKAIEGFMIRCNLCLDWFHTACICVPKTVHGKPIGKGYTAWTATREVRYLCTLCCRSRRPRLDTILQLLMSLQKLPVRVPEGEALQFLTERAMNWQDRAKQALSNTEIQRVFSEVKIAAEKSLNEKQAANNGGQVTQTAILQKLINVQKIHKLELMNDENKPSHGEQLDKSNTTSENRPKSTPPQTPTDVTVSTITGQLINKETESTDLECNEEMGGSPVAAKASSNNNSLHENPNVVHLTSATSSRAQSPIDVCTPLENLPSSTGKTAKEMITNDVITMMELPEELLDELEGLMFEGDVLEVNLDEVAHLWAVLQIQRPLLKEHCMIMNAEYRRKVVKDRKKQRKRKLEEAKAATKGAVTMAAESTKPTSSITTIATSANKNVLTKKIKTEPSATTAERPSKAGKAMKVEESQDEDDCSAKPCLKPLGDEVEWVQCDKCENWYHVICVGISAQDANNLDEYVCPYCGNPPEPNTGVVKVEPMEIEKPEIAPLKNEKIADLSVMAEVAHQIITGQDNSCQPSPSTPVVSHQIPPPSHTPENLDLNSLICLADVSEKMDVNFKKNEQESPSSAKVVVSTDS